MMGRRHNMIRSDRVFGRCRRVLGGLSRQHFVSYALGVAFLKFGHVQIMARNLEITLAHVEAGRSLSQMQVFGGAISISPRAYPKSKFPDGISRWQAATHKMQQKILIVARRTARGSRTVKRPAYSVIRSSERGA